METRMVFEAGSDLAVGATLTLVVLSARLLASMVRQRLQRSEVAYVAAVQDWSLGRLLEGDG
jgi:hypothetical protein